MKWCLIHIGIFLLMIVKTINGQDLVQIVWGGNCPEAWKDDQRFEQISSDSMENYLFESGFPFAKVTESKHQKIVECGPELRHEKMVCREDATLHYLPAEGQEEGFKAKEVEAHPRQRVR